MESGGQRLRGWVRSFRGTWGFLNCESFDGDLFVGLKGNPHLTGLDNDDEVEFEVATGDRGKVEAVNVTVIASAPKPTTAAAANGTERLRGWVRSFTGMWGFLNSDAFEGDLFVGLKSNPQIQTFAQNE